jgi:hypothetical protein
MNTTIVLLGSSVLALAAGQQPTTQPAAPAKPAATQPATGVPGAPAKEIVLNFDKDAAGRLPDGWKAEGTNQKGPIATWAVTADPSAPSAPNVLALTRTNHDSGDTFNICWTDKVRFKDGTIEARFKAVSGKEDQGGGLIWRVKDKDNYMIARMNPLEDNFRVYYVKDGGRHQIESATVKIETGTWHTMKIDQRGGHIVCFLDGKEYLNSNDDHMQGEGGVGLWTKSDAVSSFDDLKVQPARRKMTRTPSQTARATNRRRMARKTRMTMTIPGTDGGFSHPERARQRAFARLIHLSGITSRRLP